MTDKELLEMAAKAAGITLLEWTGPDDQSVPNYFWSPSLKDFWNPLTDDGDAMRLAVKLSLEVNPYFYHDERCQTPATAVKSGGGKMEDLIGVFPKYSESFEKHDPYAATRRAIVRAAAEIGKGMP